MDPFAVSHFSDNALLHDLKTLVAQDCRTTAVLITRIAEVDERKLYRREGYPSMHEYCLHELHFSEGVTYKRINAARAAREYPAVLMAVADGRLHLSGVLTLAPRLRPGNADELVAAATHRTRAEIERLIAQRFPRPDLPERLQAVPAPPWATLPAATPQNDQLAPGQVDTSTISPGQPAPGPALQQSPGTVEASTISPGQPPSVQAPAPRDRMTPLSPERFGLQTTVDRETHDLLQEAQALMSHQIRVGEIAPVLKSALQLLVPHLRKQRFAATTCPRPAARGSVEASGDEAPAATRHIPAAVKRAVWERDGGQCAFVSATGHRCQARTLVEFDHIEPVARGGEATAENIRLQCHGHNAYAAERAFGAEFMERKRAEAQRAGHRGKDAGVLHRATAARTGGGPSGRDAHQS